MNSSNRLLLFEFDRKNKLAHDCVIAGVDEAGRGPLAGPVVAAAVILDPKGPLEHLNDSKKLSEKKREKLFELISRTSLVGLGVVHPVEIDAVNIYQATRIAMKKAVLELTRTPDYLLVDGTMSLDLPLTQKAVVRGDQKSASIAAASIIAKVHRDAWMRYYDALYPSYGFRNHKGYGTKKHLSRVGQIGPSPIHRKSFNPVKEMIARSAS